jgi:hypothetical protein
MRKGLIILLSLLFSVPTLAVVDSEPADIEVQGWMVDIVAKGSQQSEYAFFCRGSLIDEYWVLSSGYCFDDPLEVLRYYVGPDELQLAASMGFSTGETIEVADWSFLAGGDLVLLRLKSASEETPVELQFAETEGLYGSDVRVYSDAISSNLGNAVYNQDGIDEVNCWVNNNFFYSNGYLCYVLSPVNYSPLLQMVRPAVMSPEEEIPNNYLNDVFSELLPTSPYLSLNYQERGGYLCYEDIGSPVIRKIDGESVQIGVVVALGITAGMPLCNNSLINYVRVLEGDEAEMDSVMIEHQFDQVCPPAVAMNYEEIAEGRFRFYWSEADGVEGYKVLYTTARGYEPVQSLDIGLINEVTADLAPGVTYSLALQAYNSSCTGPMSTPVSVGLQ